MSDRSAERMAYDGVIPVQTHLLQSNKFADLGSAKRIWVVGSIHGDLSRIQTIHDELFKLIQPGDRLIYLGNMIGMSNYVGETIDELLAFRRALLAKPAMMPNDIVYLRGGQEEMWSKLLQIQFSPNPRHVVDWMYKAGAAKTVQSYHVKPEQGEAAARDGVMALTRWTTLLRANIKARPGHEAFYTSLKRAAYTKLNAELGLPAMLFVNAGIDTSKPLVNQGDNFWWGGANWGSIHKPYGPFRKMIRGYDPAHGGALMTMHTLTIDGGCGFGGALQAACLTAVGDVIDIVEA